MSGSVSDDFDPNDPDFAGLKPSPAKMASRVAFQLLRMAVTGVFGFAGALVAFAILTRPHFATLDGHVRPGWKLSLYAPFAGALLLGGGALLLFDWIAALVAGKTPEE